MRIRWRGLELPNRCFIDPETRTDTYAKLIAEPVERGFGRTIGNSLRRVLLSSLEGSAVTAVKIKGIEHEFSTIDGVYEDVADIILNIKKLVIRMHTEEPKTIRIHKTDRGEVTGADIICDPSVEVINKDLHIATITDDVELDIEMTVKKGRGYVLAEEDPQHGRTIGVIPLDAAFSPVWKANCLVEEARVGQRTNYDRLILEVWTNGAIDPEMAIVEAAKILRKHLNVFLQFLTLGKELPPEPLTRPELPTAKSELEDILDRDLDQLGLSQRTINALKAQNINQLRDLVPITETELKKLPKVGKASVNEIKETLAELGLSLGMDLDADTSAQEEEA